MATTKTPKKKHTKNDGYSRLSRSQMKILDDLLKAQTHAPRDSTVTVKLRSGVNSKSRRDIFVEAMKDPKMSATRAAKLAGYSESTAHSQGPRLLENVGMATVILEGRQTLARKCGITAERTMKEFASIAYSNMRNYTGIFSADSLQEAMDSLTEEQSAAIQEMTVETFMERNPDDPEAFLPMKRVKFKLYPKQPALDKMGAHLGIKGFKSSISIKTATQVDPDGTVHTGVMVSMTDNDLERIAAGEEPLAEPESEE